MLPDLSIILLFLFNLRELMPYPHLQQEQYLFVYDALLEALKVGNTVIACADFKSEYENLRHIDPTRGKSRLQEQFEVSRHIGDPSSAKIGGR